MKWLPPILLVLTAVCACADDVEVRTQQLTNEPGTGEPVIDRAAANAQERAVKRAQKQPQGPTRDPIDQSEIDGYPRLTAKLPAGIEAQLADTSVPVLVPDHPELLRTMGIVAHDGWYAARFEHDHVNIHLRGTRLSFRVDGMEIPKAARDAAATYTLSRTHGIVTVAFRTFGASYTLDVECRAALEDPRCTEDDFAMNLANDLRLAGVGQ